MSKSPMGTEAGVRLDKWLWAARLFKTRSLAAEAVAKGQVRVQGQPAKPSRDLKPGDILTLRRQGFEQTLTVRALSDARRPAPEAQLLYTESEDSKAAALRFAQARKQGIEPALSLEQGRPTKRDRRQLADWQRWSVSADDT
jgi:ribosome-associated heat shock protein Hsp15